MSWWWMTKPTASPITSAPRDTKIRVLSSSRCSTSVASSPWRSRRGSRPIIGLRNGVAFARRCRRRRVLRSDRKLGALLVVLPGDGVLELTHTATERTADLRKTLRPEQQQRQQQQQDDLAGADVRHGPSVAVWTVGWWKDGRWGCLVRCLGAGLALGTMGRPLAGRSGRFPSSDGM